MNTPVSYKLAKLLKAKGFGLSKDDYIQLPRFYDSDGNYVENHLTVSKKYNPTLDTMSYLGADTINNFEARIAMMDNSLDNIYLAPSIAEILIWLYENYGIWVHVMMSFKEFTPIIQCDWRYRQDAIKDALKFMQERFNSPTEAYESAIEFVLEKCI